MPGTGENDIQPFLAAALVDRAEVHQHPPAGVAAVTDAQDDNVALVALDIFEVLHEQAAEYVVFLPRVFGFQPGGEIAVLLSQPAQSLFNFGLLRLRKCHHANAESDLPPEQAADELGNVTGLVGIAPILVNAMLHEVKTDAAREQRSDVRRTLVRFSDPDLRLIPH